MKNMIRSFTVLALLLVASGAHAQTSIDSTTLTTAITSLTSNVITIGSVTCTTCTFSAANSIVIYIDGEAMCLTNAYAGPPYNGSGTTIPVIRGCQGTKAGYHSTTLTPGTNTVVFVGPASRFHTSDPPFGQATRNLQQFMPWINMITSDIWTSDGYNWRLCRLFNVNGTAGSRCTS